MAKPKPVQKARPLRILMAGGEALPFASSGGLGDVLGSLPAALKARLGDGVDVRVVMPLYGQVKPEWREKMTFIRAITVNLSWRQQYCGIFTLEKDGVTWYFIDNEFYFKRPTLYGCLDDGERFAFFSLAVLELMREVEFYPDVLHAHDWQSALSVIYLKRRYAQDPRYAGIRAVYTIHNIEYQGRYGFHILGDVFGLGEEERSVLEYDGDINLTKGAIVCCDRLTTVSRRYAEELRDAYFAHGLEHVTNRYAYKSTGIVNGIDTGYYNPAADPDICAAFDVDHLAGKAACKADLQQSLGLEVSPDTPMVAMITRLVAHKGLDLVRHVIDELLERRMQFVLLGTGEKEYEDFFRGLAARHPGKVAVVIDFNKPLSKRIYAGADLFLMPSKSEPCGLAQMIACRYGTLPIVRETGGLFDTIVPANPVTAEGNGVTFVTYNAHDMKDAVERSLGYYSDRTLWAQLVRNAMTADFSWNASAGNYESLYRDLL
ncbi:MAG: glycogen synthase [Clostridia bacterium]|nr:glycogen synthase [Clostridia bacterium]